MLSTAMIVCWILLAEPPDGATGVDRNHRCHNLVDHHGHGAAGKHRLHGCQRVPALLHAGLPDRVAGGCGHHDRRGNHSGVPPSL